MTFKIKDGADTEGLPTITLAGEPYFVPRLELRHRIAVQLLLPKLHGILGRLRAALGIADDATEDDLKRRIEAGIGGFEMSEDDYNVYIDIVSAGLRGLYPSATREALLGETIDFEELSAAWPVVVDQGKGRRHAAGEAPATSNIPQNTGDGSSLTSN